MECEGDEFYGVANINGKVILDCKYEKIVIRDGKFLTKEYSLIEIPKAEIS